MKQNTSHSIYAFTTLCFMLFLQSCTQATPSKQNDALDTSVKTPQINFKHTLNMQASTFNYEGPLEITIGDNFDTGEHETHFAIINPTTQEAIPVTFNQEIQTDILRSQLIISAEGEMQDEKFVVNQLNVNQQSFESIFSNTESKYDRSIIIAKVSFTSGQIVRNNGNSTADISAQINRTNQQYLEGTWGYLQVNNDPDGDGSPAIYDIDMPFTSRFCSSSQLSTLTADVASRIQSKYNVSVNDFGLFQVITPDLPECGGLGGFAEFGGVNSPKTLRSIIVKLFGNKKNSVVIPHELGHNFNMFHAADNFQTYGDDSCLMGNGSSIGFKTMSLNVVHMDHLHAFDQYPNRRGVITSSGTYILYPLRQNPVKSDGPQALKIAGSKTVYLSYRTAINLDKNLTSKYSNKVAFHHTYSGIKGSQLKANLSNGQRYSDSESGVTVQVLEMASDSSYAKVEVTLSSGSRNNNSAPVANNQTVIVQHNTEASFSLDYNDSNFGPGPFSYTSLSSVKKGTGAGTGAYKTYTPPNNYIGTDTMTWRMNDGEKDSGEGQVTLKVLQPGEPSEQFNDTALTARVESGGKVTFSLTNSNAAQLATCDMQYGDQSSNQTCVSDQEHTYPDGDFEACALLKDRDNKVMIACTQFNITDGGLGNIPGVPGVGANAIEFVSSSACQGQSKSQALGNVLLLLLALSLSMLPVERKTEQR